MALTWEQHIARGGLRVKRARATVHQAQMGHLIVVETRRRGGDFESQLGAVADAIQESVLTNVRGGDRDSAGLYQQRPSMGWGTYAQITDPRYAVNKFLDTYLAYRRKGHGWVQASHLTQRSAFASAPAQWGDEGVTFAKWFTGAGSSSSPASGVGASGGGSASSGGTTTETREVPYEYSRGSADKREDSWECSGRLASEVNWMRFMRRGRLWYVSPNWLIAQAPLYTLQDFAPGVLSITFDWETRHPPAEATIRVLARRYNLAPGDVVRLTNSGPATGKWLVASMRRQLDSPVVEASLKRFDPALAEPAPQTETVTIQGAGQVSVGGSQQTTGKQMSTNTSNPAAAAYRFAQQMSDAQLPYIWGGGHGADFHQGLARGYDCSGSVAWALHRAGIPLPEGRTWGRGAPVSGAFTSWGESGPGRFMTVYANSEHIWIRWNGLSGGAWRFDTSPYGCGGRGPLQRGCARPTSGFSARHWRGT